MEGDSASQMFDFDINDEVHLIENPHSHMHPTQQNAALMKFLKENAEKEASARSNRQGENSKQKLPASATHGDGENVDYASNDNVPDLAVPPSQMPSTVAKERSRIPSQIGEVEGNQVNASNLENTAHRSQENGNNLLMLATAAELSTSVPLPFHTPFTTATAQGNENQQLPNWFSSQQNDTQLRVQANQFLAPHIFDSEFANNCLSPGSYYMNLRPQHYSANNLVSENVLNSFSMMPGQSMLSRPQNLPGESDQLLQFAANTHETQDWTNTMLPAVSMPLSLRAQNFGLPATLSQPIIRPIPTYPSFSGHLHQTNQLLNPPTEQHSILERHNRAPNTYDVGESSSSSSSPSSKRSKISCFPDTGAISAQPRANEIETHVAANPSNQPRQFMNAVYDPMFESMGLPIDPHLRLFNSNNY